jgi:hypothetical protein
VRLDGGDALLVEGNCLEVPGTRSLFRSALGNDSTVNEGLGTAY